MMKLSEDIIRILNSCKIINLKNKEPFPKPEHEWDPLIIVGLSNGNWGPDHYKCDTFYYVKYTTHGYCTWGGYTMLGKDNEPKLWWTMNHVYNDDNNTEFAYVVDNKEDGYKLAEFLDSINGYFDINKIEDKIYLLKSDIIDLENKINYYEDIKKYLINK